MKDLDNFKLIKNTEYVCDMLEDCLQAKINEEEVEKALEENTLIVFSDRVDFIFWINKVNSLNNTDLKEFISKILNTDSNSNSERVVDSFISDNYEDYSAVYYEDYVLYSEDFKSLVKEYY